MNTLQYKKNLRVAELIYFTSDLDRSVEFYNGLLGWEFENYKDWGLAIFDVGGKYKLLVMRASAWDSKWKEGEPLPRPILSLESDDLAAAVARLRQAGCDVDEVQKNSDVMLSSRLRDPQGGEVFMWQDTSGDAKMPEGKKVEGSSARKEVPAARSARLPYPFVEALYFYNDLEQVVKYYTEKVGFTEMFWHGSVYVALDVDGKHPFGLMRWRDWFDAPAEGETPGPPRLALEAGDIAAEYNRLEEAGTDIGPLKGKPSSLQWATLADPDGNELTFWHYAKKGSSRPLRATAQAGAE
ncbi:VOC family protein [bacterium]|nr:VOC family protein [bacterium]